MSIKYSNVVKQTRMQVIIDALGSTGYGGKLVLGTVDLDGSSAGRLVELPLARPAGTIVTNGTAVSIQFNTTTHNMSAEAFGTGAAARAELRKSDGTIVASNLTVGTTGTDIVLGTTAVNAGNTVVITNAVLNHG